MDENIDHIRDEMRHFDDLKEDHGHQLTEQLEVLPNKPRCDDFEDTQPED